jgi:glutamine---fructose-6-phosphate transaminase (isomerizing)
MCGIVGSIGNEKHNVMDFLITGLKRLEYRGYDSSGVCILNGENFNIIKSVGKINELEKKLEKQSFSSHLGVGHTRWATHGKVCENNAHPHKSEYISIVHNGIIENYSELKEELIKKNVKFESETDTEVIVHLLNLEYKKAKDEKKSIFNTVSKLKGMFSLGIIFKNNPSKMYAIKVGTPLVIGLSDETSYLASDVYPLVEYADKYAYLEDFEVAEMKKNKIKVYDLKGKEIKKEFLKLDFSNEEISKGEYKYYMEKEIHEQPRVIINTIQGRISADRTKVIFEKLEEKIKIKDINKIYIVACGSSWHAAMIGKYLIEKNSKISVNVDIASEFRYRENILDKKSLVIFISQSGETADTIAACKTVKKECSTIAICNKPNSSLDRECDYTILTQAGVEIGVAATKSFTAQVCILILLSLYLGLEKKVIKDKYLKEILDDIVKLPHIIEKQLKNLKFIEEIVNDVLKYQVFLFIGRGVNYPLALEGALKLKEISYLHAEGYPSGELKHGPIALVDQNLLLIALCPKDKLYEKSISNIQEVKSRGGSIFSIGTSGDEKLKSMSEFFIGLEKVSSDIMPILEVIPLQVLALNIAVRKGTDVDKPRNLAKSVTVE